jgi:hypothetical protein
MLQVIHDYMTDPLTAWQICGDGEFRARGDAPSEKKLDYTGGSIVTQNGAMQIMVNAMTRLVPSEAVTPEDGLWIQGALFCLPPAECRMSQRKVVTEIGHDPLAVRAEDRAGFLFDLGIGGPALDICVRTRDQDLCRLLRAHSDNAAIDDAGADRVILSRLGRIEWFGANADPAPLFSQLPTPAGLHACFAFVSPQRTTDGEMDRATYETFQNLLHSFGDPDALKLKQSVFDAVRAGEGPNDDAPQGDAVKIALRQLRYLDGPSETLRAWLGD